MFFAPDLNTVTHGIQLAVAPVFLLTAIAGMIGTVAGRLARIIDRARVLEERLEAKPDAEPTAQVCTELMQLRQRGTLANTCIALLTFCSICIALTIVTLFLGQTTAINTLQIATILFLVGVGSFVLALIGFLLETVIATQVLNFGRGALLRRTALRNKAGRQRGSGKQ